MNPFKWIWYAITFRWNRLGFRTREATIDAMSTPEGIRMAGLQDRQKKASKFKEQWDAVSGYAADIKDLKAQLAALDKEEQQKLLENKQCVKNIAAAKASGNKAMEDANTAVYVANKARIAQIDALQAKLEPKLAQKLPMLDMYKAQLAQSQEELANVDTETKEMILELIGAENEIALAAKMNSAFAEEAEEESNLSLIRQRVQQKVAKAEVASELTGQSTTMARVQVQAQMKHAGAMSDLEAELAALQGAEKPATESEGTKEVTIN